MGELREGLDRMGDLAQAEIAAAPDGVTGLDARHPSVRHFGPLFAYGHLREGRLRDASEACAELAAAAIADLPDNPELAAGLRKLLEAKDCFVRAALQ